MIKTKKIISLVLSVIMLVSCFTFTTSALNAGKTIAFKLVADKTTVSAGDTVTYSLYVDADPTTTFGNMALIFSYNSKYFVAPKSANLNRTFLNTFDEVYLDSGIVSAGSAGVHRNIKANMSAEELALYDAAFQIQFNIDTGVTTTADGFTIADTSVPQMTFTMTVADGVADGTPIPVAVTTAGFLATSRGGFVNVANGTASPDIIAIDTIDVSEASLSVSTASAVAAPVVEKSAGQIKMKAISPTQVEDAFQLRIISKISSTDWDNHFANSADKNAEANYITKVGMVAYRGAGAIDMDEVKKVVAAGANSGDYYYGDTDYINHAEGGDATFGTILDCTHGSPKLQNNPKCVGFVSYVDANKQPQTIYYAEAYEAPIVSNYDTIAANYAGSHFGK